MMDGTLPREGNAMQSNGWIESEAELEALYEMPPKRRAILKEIDHISDHYRAFIDAAPFAVLATVGPEGLDCSPRGDPAGFVQVQDPKTVLLPDRRGNNRLDSLRNIVRDPRVSLLFLIPGVGETLRINGRGRIGTDPELLERFEMRGQLPRSVLSVAVDRVYIQCPKALVRSRLWRPETRVPRDSLPTLGQIMQALDTEGEFEAKAWDRAYSAELEKTIY